MSLRDYHVDGYAPPPPPVRARVVCAYCRHLRQREEDPCPNCGARLTQRDLPPPPLVLEPTVVWR